MPIMEINEKLTRIIRGRTIELVTQEEGLVTIVFDDYSTMRVKPKWPIWVFLSRSWNPQMG
jgi:hypothetical protein